MNNNLMDVYYNNQGGQTGLFQQTYESPTFQNDTQPNLSILDQLLGKKTADGSLDLGSMLGNFGSLAKGIGGLYGAYLGSQQLGLAKEQFAYNRDQGNRNIANQSKLINNDLQARYRAGLANMGQRGAGAEKNVNAYMKTAGVDGTPV